MDQWSLSRALAAQQQQQQQQQQQAHPTQAGQFGYSAAAYSGQQGGSGAYGAQLYSQQGYGQIYGQQMLGSSAKAGASDDYQAAAAGRTGAGFGGSASVNTSGLYGIDAKYPGPGFGAAKTDQLGVNQKGSDYLLAQYSKGQASYTAEGQNDVLARYSESQQQLLQSALRQGVTPSIDGSLRTSADYLSAGRSAAARTAGAGDYAGRDLLGTTYGVTRSEAEAALLAGRSGVGVLPYPSQQGADALGSLAGGRGLLGPMYSSPGYSGAELGRDYAAAKSLGGGISGLSDIGSVRYDDRMDDRLALRHEFERRDDDRRERDRSRERGRERERSWEREREREREHERMRERERREREWARERERERERDLRRREKSPPRMPPPRREERPVRKISPRREPPPRLISPPRIKRRDYVCKVEPYSLVEVERDLLSLIRRYPKLFVAADFSKAVACWMKEGVEVNLNQPVSFEHDAVDVVEESDSKETSGTTSSAEVKRTKESVVWSAKVMLMSGLSSDNLKELLSDKAAEDRPMHMHNFLRFVVLRKDRSALMAVGGMWDKMLDGGDPSDDDTVLIRTAIRCTKEFTELDLSGVSNWTRFMEVHYDRVREDGSNYKEITVLYLPDLSGCLPSLESWKMQWKQKREARLKREASAKSEKDGKSGDASESLKGNANGTKADKDGKVLESKKDKDEKKEDKKDKKEKEEKKSKEDKKEKDAKEDKKEKDVKEDKKEKDIKEDKMDNNVKKEEKKEKEKDTKKTEKKEKVEKKDKKDKEETKVEKDVKETKDKSADKKEKAKTEEEAPLTPGFFVTTKRSSTSKVRSISLSLDGLLDYDERDKEESTFELSLFAEFFQEMLQFKFGCSILASLEDLHKVVSARKKEEKKRGRHDEKDSETAGSKKKSKFSDKPTVDTKSDDKAVKNDEKAGKGSAEKDVKKDDKEDKDKKEEVTAVKDIDAAMQEASLINFEDLEEDMQQKSESQEGSPDDEKDETEEGSKEEKSERKTVVDEELLKAYRYFDKNRVGFLKAEDVRRLLHILGKFLTSRWVKDIAASALLECKSRDDHITYERLAKKDAE